jgi:LDH2 family malate/lactate/ureidoglycolate dehydrogenase
LHALPKQTPETQLLYPGEPEATRREERRRSGIPVEPGLLRELLELGERLDVDTSELET